RHPHDSRRKLAAREDNVPFRRMRWGVWGRDRKTARRVSAVRRRVPPDGARRRLNFPRPRTMLRSPMRIGVPKEIKTQEFRVGMTPSGVATLVARGHQVLVEQNAGVGS